MSRKFPGRLQSARKMRELSQEELAQRSGLKAAAISHFETGNRKPSFDNLRRLADALSVTADYLLGRVDSPEAFAAADIAFRNGMEQLSTGQREVLLEFMNVLAGRNKDK